MTLVRSTWAMTTIAHASDLHGNLDSLLAGTDLPDVWVLTGDIFPNETRGNRSVEVPFQTAWFDTIADALVARLGGRPVVCVGGNHDYVNLAHLLRSRGVEAYDVEEGPVDILGHRFAGFGSIPYLVGEWNREEIALGPVVDACFEQDPTILVTHAPASGILDQCSDGHGDGVRPLTAALQFRPHRIVAHLHGHIHEQAQQDVEEMGIHFFNGACGCRFISV